MKLTFLILLITSMAGSSLAQDSKITPSDTMVISPNTVRVTGEVVSSRGKTAVIKVSKVVATGAGIINVLSEGQTITVQLREDDVVVAASEKVEMDLKEKIGVAAALSSYTVIRTRKLH